MGDDPIGLWGAVACPGKNVILKSGDLEQKARYLAAYQAVED